MTSIVFVPYMMSIVIEICILSTIHSTPHMYEDN